MSGSNSIIYIYINIYIRICCENPALSYIFKELLVQTAYIALTSLKLSEEISI